MKNKRQAEKIAKGIISYIRSQKQEHLLGLIIQSLQKYAGIPRSVQVFIPTKLNKKQEDSIKTIVYKLVGSNKVGVEFILDSGLIDGLKIVSADKVWDFSMASQIEKISKVRI